MDVRDIDLGSVLSKGAYSHIRRYFLGDSRQSDRSGT